MDANHPESTTPVLAETILTAALKLLGIYLLYTAIFHSATLMGTMFSFSALISNASQLNFQQWALLVSSGLGTVLAVGMGIVLIRHGGRAAHWFALRADLEVPVGNPTRKWYIGSMVFVGVWVLATHFPASLFALTWAVVQTIAPPNYDGAPNPAAYLIFSVLHSGTALALGLVLIFGARRIGDWLYRISGADRDDTIAPETQ